jgi:NAD(P)-dependent dehydrogenase (short-subunit alcohol dehydrogenase family)
MSQPRETDGLSTAAKPKEHIIKFDGGSADAFGQVDLLVNNAGIPNVAPLTPEHRIAPRRTVQRRRWPLLPGSSSPPLQHGQQTSRRGPGRPPSKAARTASACSRLRSSSRRPISPTSAPAARATSTGSIASSSVRRRRPRRVPAFGQHQTMTAPGALGAGRALDGDRL